MITTGRNAKESRLLGLPAEIRNQIYEYVIGNRIVHVRMSWQGICIPAGFLYSCLEDVSPLLEPVENDVLAHAVPFGSDVHCLGHICRQLRKETACLPFRVYIWAFETAFTLDQWVCMKLPIPMQHKNAIKAVAVPTPGPFRSSERILCDLQEVLLIGNFKAPTTPEHQSEAEDAPSRALLRLRKDVATDSWVRQDERAQYNETAVAS